MINYLKNFLYKLLLLPFIAFFGLVFLLVFLFAPHFKLVKQKRFGQNKSKDFEAFY